VVRCLAQDDLHAHSRGAALHLWRAQFEEQASGTI